MEGHRRQADSGCTNGEGGARTHPSRCAAGVGLLPPILRALARGGPLPPDEIVRALGLPPYVAASVTATLAHVFPDAEFDAEGRLLGVGLSLVPTPHEVALTGLGQVLYAWCPLDAILLPGLIGESARVTSPCPATGRRVTVMVGPEGARDLQPANAVLAIMTDADERNLRASGCAHQRFFVSDAAAASWRAAHPCGVTLSVADAFGLAARQWGYALPPEPEAGGIGRSLGRVVLAELRASGQPIEELPCRWIAEHSPASHGTGAQAPSQPGDFWWDTTVAGWLDSEAHRARGGGPHLIVRLPNGWDWDLDGPMNNGPGWWRTGDPPLVTAWPSIVAGEYHGFLVTGRLYRLAGERG